MPESLERLERRFKGEAILEALDREAFDVEEFVLEALAAARQKHPMDIGIAKVWARKDSTFAWGIMLNGQGVAVVRIEPLGPFGV